jgi:hypothetical protein
MMRHDIRDVIGTMVGVIIIIYFISSLVVRFITSKHLQAKAIRSLYLFIDKPEDSKVITPKNVKTLKFYFFDKLIPLREAFMRALCCCRKYKAERYLDQSEMSYFKTTKLLEQDLNLFKIVQTINKLKSVVQVLANEDPQTLEKIKRTYWETANFHQNTKQLQFESKVKQFLD